MPDPPAPKRIRAPLTPPADGPDESPPRPRFPTPSCTAKRISVFSKALRILTSWCSGPPSCGYRALAITDLNSVAGVVRAHVAAKEVGLKLLIGAEITPDDAPPVVLLATDRAAYGRLSQLITRGHRQAEKGDCRLTQADVADFADGLLACVRLPEGRDEDAVDRALPALSRRVRRSLSLAWRTLLRDRRSPASAMPAARLPAARLAPRGGQRRSLSRSVPPAAAGCADCRSSRHHGRRAGGIAVCQRRAAFKSPAEMRRLFANCPEAVSRTVEMADRCTFSLDELRYEYPEELSPPGLTPFEHLTSSPGKEPRERLSRGLPDKVRQLLEYELKLIAELHYEAYFLTVWDLVKFARSRDILCQGRGSAANSAVCYCLGVTAVDPDRIDLLFERFVSRNGTKPPTSISTSSTSAAKK